MQPPPFHRAYRYVELPAAAVAWNVLFALLPAVAVSMFARPVIRAHAGVVAALLNWMGVPTSSRFISLGRVTFSIPDLPAPATADTLFAATLAIVGLVVAAAALLIARRLTPLRVIAGGIAIVCSTSGFFFWLGGRFPYAAADFAGAWCRAEFIVWIVISLLYAVVLSPLPLSAGATLLFTTEAIVYAMWFSAVRLALLMFLFQVGSLMWMAPAYFACGFLVDFLYIVAYYSLAVARAARRLEDRRDVWRW